MMARDDSGDAWCPVSRSLSERSIRGPAARGASVADSVLGYDWALVGPPPARRGGRVAGLLVPPRPESAVEAAVPEAAPLQYGHPFPQRGARVRIPDAPTGRDPARDEIEEFRAMGGTLEGLVWPRYS